MFESVAVNIAVAAVVAVFGVVLGAKIQRTARFIYPTDFMTIFLAIIVAADACLQVSGIDRVWYVPLALGYAAGYLVVGRTAYAMVWTTDLASKRITLTPWVMWSEDGSTFLQVQSNRALARRLFFGIKHDVVSNVPLDDDWTTSAKYPAFPVFVRPAIVAESVHTGYADVPAFWKFKTRHYVTEITVAYAGAVSKMELAQDEDCLRRMQTQNNALIAEIHELRSQQGPALMEMALRLEQEVSSTTPLNRMYELIRVGKDRMKEIRQERRTTQKKEEEKDGSDQQKTADQA